MKKKDLVEVRPAGGGPARRTWRDAREGDRAEIVAGDSMGAKGVVKIWPGGPVIQWDLTGELEPDLHFTLTGAPENESDSTKTGG